MKNLDINYFDVQFKPHYLHEFIIGGIPIPTYTATDKMLTLNFKKQESYSNYLFLLNEILGDLELADLRNYDYEIQRSKAFIRYILLMMNNSFLLLYPLA